MEVRIVPCGTFFRLTESHSGLKRPPVIASVSDTRMALDGNSQAHRTHERSLLTKSDTGRPFPTAKSQILFLNQSMFRAYGSFIKPPKDAPERELKAWSDFVKWVRFHNPPFSEELKTKVVNAAKIS